MGNRQLQMKKIYYWFVGSRTRITYWSCGDLAAWIRKISGVSEKPGAATSEGWGKWKNENVGKIGYWIAEEGLNYIQDTVMFVPDVYENCRVYIVNRYIDKPHYIDTKLEKGKWHEFDTRLLHGLFEMLVNFVEVEKAHWQHIGFHLEDDENKKKHKTPSREDGLAYLDWEIGLVYEEDQGVDSELIGQPTHQAIAAKEIKELYLWWKDIRPNRPDPYDESGWSEHCKQERLDGRGLFEYTEDKRTEEEIEEDKKRRSEIFDLLRKIEEDQEQEDTDMLIRLIKIRKKCWT